MGFSLQQAEIYTKHSCKILNFNNSGLKWFKSSFQSWTLLKIRVRVVLNEVKSCDVIHFKTDEIKDKLLFFDGGLVPLT